MEKQRVRYILETIADPIELRRKLLPLVEECGKLSGKDTFGWALLAKLVYACDQEMLRTISSRIQKRLVAAVKQPITIPLLHFVRSFLVRFQWLKSFNEQTLAYICSRAVDFSVENSSKSTTRVAYNIYALWAGTKYDYILIKTLKNILSGVTVEEDNESNKALFRFETSVQRYFPQFISTLFDLHSEVMARCSQDDKVAMNDWLDIAFESAALVETEKLDSIFRWLKTFMLKAKSCAYLVIRRISSFINDFYRPSEAYYEAVKEYVQLGPDLSVNILFRTLISSAKSQLHSQFQEYGKAYAEALGAMLELRPYLLDVQDVIELQHLVCQEAFQNRSCKPALSVLSSLLAMNNELVPSPVQIAQSIFSGIKNWCDDVRLGRALCSSISRPRIQITVPEEKLLKKLNDALMSDRQMCFSSSQNSSKLDISKKSTPDNTSVNSEFVGNKPVGNDENPVVKSVENVRKREYPSAEKTTLKHVRLDSDEEMFCPEAESSHSSELGITIEEEVSEKAQRIVKQEDSEERETVDANARKFDSDSHDIILNKDVVDRDLTVQQMMADFVPD